jgi:ATP-binding cassette subfamily B protein
MKLLYNIKPKFLNLKLSWLNKKYSSLGNLKPYVISERKKVINAFVLMILSSLLSLSSPYIIKYIIDDVIAKKDTRVLFILILLLLSIQLIRMIVSLATDYYFSLFNQEIMLRIKKDVFSKILRLPLSFFDRNQTGYLLSRISEVDGLKYLVSKSSLGIITGGFEFLFAIVILYWMNWKLASISLIILPLFYIASKYYSNIIKKTSTLVWENQALLSRKIQESLMGIDLIKVFSAEEREKERIDPFLSKLKKANLRQVILSSLSSELLIFIGAIGGGIVLYYSGMNIIRGEFTVGGYIAFSAYLAKLYGPTQNIGTFSLTVQPAFSALERLAEINRLNEEENNRYKRIKLENNIIKIEFRDVCFSYGHKRVLNNANLLINKGDKVLLSGANGSGKSTIIKLMLGLYEQKQGEILINDINIGEISLNSLRERISLVSQSTFLFDDTILNNILYSNPKATDEEIEEALLLSGVHKFVSVYKNGLSTIIGESGRKLSGGEKQKISIARALLKDSDLLIFDEATTYLDQQSIKEIEDLIINKYSDKMCFIVSHQRLSLLGFNKLLFIKNGHIEESNEQQQKYYYKLAA